jgi:anti-anti-sigma factor
MVDSVRQQAVFLHVEHTARKRSDEVHVWIRGELDIATHAQLQSGLSNIPLDDAAVVTLHLSELTFCDARGACLLLQYGQQARDRGLLASIDSPSRPVRRILRLIDPDSS